MAVSSMPLSGESSPRTLPGRCDRREMPASRTPVPGAFEDHGGGPFVG